MQGKPKKFDWRKPSSNPLNNLDLSEYTNPEKKKKKEKEKKKKETLKNLQDDYKKILHQNVQKEHRAYRIVYKNHPELFYLAFKHSRESAKYESAMYFRNMMNPFFTGEGYREEMLNSRAYRLRELDKYAFEDCRVPIPELLRSVDVSMPCSVCGKSISYEDLENKHAFIIEGEGNTAPFIRGHLLCHKCYKRYLEK